MSFREPKTMCRLRLIDCWARLLRLLSVIVIACPYNVLRWRSSTLTLLEWNTFIWAYDWRAITKWMKKLMRHKSHSHERGWMSQFLCVINVVFSVNHSVGIVLSRHYFQSSTEPPMVELLLCRAPGSKLSFQGCKARRRAFDTIYVNQTRECFANCTWQWKRRVRVVFVFTSGEAYAQIICEITTSQIYIICCCIGMCKYIELNNLWALCVSTDTFRVNSNICCRTWSDGSFILLFVFYRYYKEIIALKIPHTKTDNLRIFQKYLGLL